MRILVVEDDAEYRNVLKEVLEMHGHSVLAAADGIEALELLRGTPPEVIISDVNMPNRTGSQLHDLVRNDRRLKHIPFVYVTGFAILRVATPLESHLDYMVSKVPFDGLLQVVRDISTSLRPLSDSNIARRAQAGV
jgi:CheY-like chemotaxis protein